MGFKDQAEDQGIQTSEDSKFFGISAGFDSFGNAGKELIVQYQAQYEKDVECGGGYLKLGPKLDDPKTFGDPTPYNIMFGPNKCGYSKRTHLIFSYKGKNVLKKSDLEYKQEGEGTSHVYRLVVKPDNTVRVEIDEEKIYEGSLKEDWELLKPKQIPDPEDKKPEDWVMDSMMDDPEDKKPEDWVEDKRIVDAEVKGGTIFDNVIITDDVAEADVFVKKWKDLNEVEKEEKKKEDEAKKAEDAKKEESEAEDDEDKKETEEM